MHKKSKLACCVLFSKKKKINAFILHVATNGGPPFIIYNVNVTKVNTLMVLHTKTTTAIYTLLSQTEKVTE